MSFDELSNNSGNTQMSEKSRNNPAYIVEPSTFEGTEKRYYDFITDFYYNKCLPSEINLMIDIINNKTPISISFIEWFVMKYTKLHRITYKVSNRYCNENIDVNISYDSQIDSFGKDNFDPCRRKKKFYFEYEDKKILTTIAQLIFFRWCFHYEIIQYILNNLDTINANKDSVKKYYSFRIKTTPTTSPTSLATSPSFSNGGSDTMSNASNKNKFVVEI